MDQLMTAGNYFQLALKHLSDIEQAQAWVVLKDQAATLRRKDMHVVGGAA
jgi:hypothetical protein